MGSLGWSTLLLLLPPMSMVQWSTGLIEVCIDGNWLTVCYDGHDQFTEGNRRAVNFTCQDMGYDGMQAGISCSNVSRYTPLIS